MDLEACVRELLRELEMGELGPEHIVTQNPVTFSLALDDEIAISLKGSRAGVFMAAPVAPIPTLEAEKLIERLMEGNLFGIETRGARLGMEMDGEWIVLRLDMPYEMNYSTFHDSVEDFANLVAYWRQEITLNARPST